MEHHLLAEVCIAGSCLDVLGSIYLAYDLLGGQHGPLRMLTRAVTYSIVFGLGYGFGLGLFFGISSGIATGFTLTMELGRASRGKHHYSLFMESVFSLIRGFAFGAGLYRQVGLGFAAVYALMITAGQIFFYTQGVRPEMATGPSRHPQFTKRILWGSTLRTFGYIVTALLCSTFVKHVDHPFEYALRLGLVTGIVTTVGIVASPFIEHFADNLPARRMGAFGICLIFIGFTLQSVQYWLVLLDVPVK